MDKFLKLAVLVGALLAGVGVFYHYVIFLPGIEREKAAQGLYRQATYSLCIADAESAYDASWAAACKSVAQSQAVELQHCLSDKTVLTNPYMGAAYCKRTYGDTDTSPECTLPKGRADSINAAHKQAQQRCATEARLGLR